MVSFRVFHLVVYLNEEEEQLSVYISSFAIF